MDTPIQSNPGSSYSRLLWFQQTHRTPLAWSTSETPSPYWPWLQISIRHSLCRVQYNTWLTPHLSSRKHLAGHPLY